mgnify:CR=1 FL=1
MDEILINTGLFHQLLMSAMLRDPSVADDQNLVGVLDGVQTVGDDQQGLTLYQLRDGLLNVALVVGVHTGGRLVQNDNGSVFQNAAGDRDALFLTPERVAPPSPTTV